MNVVVGDRAQAAQQLQQGHSTSAGAAHDESSLARRRILQGMFVTMLHMNVIVMYCLF